MNTYTYSKARQKLSAVLNKAKREGRVLIRRKDGTVFELKPINKNKSPLNVRGVNINLNIDEIIDILREVRER